MKELWLGLIGVFLLVVVRYYQKKNREFRKEFYEVITYMEQVVCSYRRGESLAEVLEDCKWLFSKKDKMCSLIEQAIHILQMGEGMESKEIAKTALKVIEDNYISERLKLFHFLIVKIEKMEIESSLALDILLQEIEMWRRRMALHQEKIRQIRKESSVAWILSIILCYLSYVMMPPNQIQQSGMYLGLRMSIIVLFLLIETVVLCVGTSRWADIENKLKKTCKQKRMREDFVYWFLVVTLYLQGNNVYQAIYHSLEQAKGILKLEVEKLLEDLYVNPSSPMPFQEFLSKWQLEEVQSGMKVLYSVSNNTEEDVNKQIQFLAKKCNEMIELYEIQKLEQKQRKLEIWKQMPFVIAGGKVILDLLFYLNGS